LWSRYVSLASVIAAVVFPAALGTGAFLIKGWDIRELWPLIIAAVAIPLMVILRHRENIKRLIAGTESKV
jgi:acyl phosphate:glycerol-3-phosphate acyltransferase